MKKILLFLCIALLISCSGSDDSTPSKSIVGKWEYQLLGSPTSHGGIYYEPIGPVNCSKRTATFFEGGLMYSEFYLGQNCDYLLVHQHFLRDGKNLTVIDNETGNKTYYTIENLTDTALSYGANGFIWTLSKVE